jgi:phosphoenolpyruvate---glycerone phosphotransferase subunit DhaK
VNKVLAGSGVKPVRVLTGSYVTSLEMAGCSVTVSAADDATLKLWDTPVHTAALRWGM